jgi:hypothetical protein
MFEGFGKLFSEVGPSSSHLPLELRDSTSTSSENSEGQ